MLPSGVRVQQCNKENTGSVWCARVRVESPDHEYANVESRKSEVEATYENVEGFEKVNMYVMYVLSNVCMYLVMYVCT